MPKFLMMMLANPVVWAPEGAVAGGGEAEDAGAGGVEGAAPAAGAATESTPTSDAAPASALSGAGEAPADAGDAPAESAEGAGFDPAALTLPEGFTLPEGMGEKLSTILNDTEMTAQDRGQALADLHTSIIAEAQEASIQAASEAWTNLNSEWTAAVRELPEFKNNLEGELGGVKQALVTLGASEEFFAAMDLTGAGNNPHVLQMLHKLTAPHREGAAVGGGATASPGLSGAEKMFPSMRTQG